VALTINTRIAELRRARGLTQLELAQQVQVTETTIANWEKGRSGAEWILKVIALCKILDCQPEDLIVSAENSESNTSSGQKSLSLRDVQVMLGTKRQMTQQT
jgi:transcriptional regulator with XRE-family HTH domain